MRREQLRVLSTQRGGVGKGTRWMPGSVLGQAGQGFEQPGLVERVPAHGRGVGTR